MSTHAESLKRASFEYASAVEVNDELRQAVIDQRARIAELEAEVAGLTHDVERHLSIVSECEDRAAKFEALNAELVEVVNDFRDHGYLRGISCNGRNKTAEALVKRLVAAAKACS